MMEKENWIKWIQARIPSLKESHNEIWLSQALDGFLESKLNGYLELENKIKQSECEHNWHTYFNKGYRKCNKCSEIKFM